MPVYVYSFGKSCSIEDMPGSGLVYYGTRLKIVVYRILCDIGSHRIRPRQYPYHVAWLSDGDSRLNGQEWLS
jgi:hypothetical protein